MNLKCKNAKDYSLTKDKEYEVKHDEENFIHVVNNENKIARYHKDLFEDPIIPDTYEQILASMISIADDEIAITIDGVTTELSKLVYDCSHVSCGIAEFDGLNEPLMLIDELNITEELKKLIFIKYLEISCNSKKALNLFSTNINTPAFDLINSVLEEISITSTTHHNPDSGNEIKLWVVESENLDF